MVGDEWQTGNDMKRNEMKWNETRISYQNISEIENACQLKWHTKKNMKHCELQKTGDAEKMW